jgi:hypothetical protein
MPEVVKPRGVVLYAYSAGSYLPIACAKEVSFSSTSTFIPVATKTGSKYEAFIPERIQQTLQGSGLTIMNSNTSLWSWTNIEDYLLAQTSLIVRIIVAGVNGSLRLKSYNGYFENLTITGSASNFSNYQFSFKITGQPTITTVFAPTGVTCGVFDIEGNFLVDADGNYVDGACGASAGGLGDFSITDFSAIDFSV